MGKWSALRRLISDAVRYLDLYVIPVDPFPRMAAGPFVLSHYQLFGGSMAEFGYTIAPPVLAQNEDVTSFKLYATVDAAAFGPFALALGETHELVVTLGSQVAVHFTAVDAAGNESQPGAALQFTSVDDVPPSAPSAPQVISHRQIFAAATTPVDPPAPTTPVDPPAPTTPTEPTTPVEPVAPVTPVEPAPPTTPVDPPAPPAPPADDTPPPAPPAGDTPPAPPAA